MKIARFYPLPLLFSGLLLVGCTKQVSTNASPESKSTTAEISPGIPYPDTGWQTDNGDFVANPTPNVENGVAAESPQVPAIPHRVVKEDIYTAAIDPNPEVVRYDRYTLVSNAPKGGQKYLLEQIVNVDMGKRGNYLTVEQGLWNTLEGTGYKLCIPFNTEVQNLFTLPLPKVHYKFGPVKLRDALQMLAGEAFELIVNDAYRQICYAPRGLIPDTRPAIPKYIDANTVELN